MRNLWRLTLWGGAAASALLVAVLASRSDTGAQRIAGLFSIRGDRTQVAAPAFDAEAETHRLAEAVRALNAENQDLKSRLAAVEHNVDDITGSVARQIETLKAANPAPSPDPASAPNLAAPATAVPAAKAAVVEHPATSAPPPVQPAPAAPAPPRPATREPAAAGLHTAAPPQNAAAPAPRAESPAPQYGVDIGSAVSIQVLRAHWLGIRSAHAQLFDGLMPVVMLREAPHTGRIELRLVLGPLATAEAAAELCTALAPYRLSCQPTMFSGQHVALQ